MGVIGCLHRARPIPHSSVQLVHVWFLCWYLFRVWLRSSLSLYPGRLRLLDSSFPLQPRRCGAAMVQRPMCHTLKTLIHACNQTRSYLVRNQQQKQPNTIRCIVSACISPFWTGSPSRLPVTKATNHPLSDAGPVAGVGRSRPHRPLGRRCSG